MPPTYESAGPFPSSSAIANLSLEERKRLFFRTTSSTEYKDRGMQPEAQVENFIDVHCMGMRNGKYMKYQVKRAPLFDRTACKYSRDYVPLPLGDNQCNRELAVSFKEGLGAGGKGLQAPMLARSMYSDSFPQLSPQQVRAAKQRSCRPKKELTQTLGGTGDMLELRSHAHERFGVLPGHGGSVERFIPKGNITVGGGAVPPKSSYRAEFGPSPMAAGARSILHSHSTPQLPGAALDPYEAMLDHPDDDLSMVRRACYLSPGQ